MTLCNIKEEIHWQRWVYFLKKNLLGMSFLYVYVTVGRRNVLSLLLFVFTSNAIDFLKKNYKSLLINNLTLKKF